MYTLQSTDGRGDQGNMSCSFKRINSVVEIEHDARPKIGWQLRVGSFYARSYSQFDWWQTTTITEIISDTPNKVVFKTLNSEYTWTID